MDMTVLVPIANGTEEMEAVIIVDILRRAGIPVTLAGDNSIVTCSRKVKILPDAIIDDIPEDADFLAIILHGGSTGVKNLSENHKLETLLKAHFKKEKLIGAICAAPYILKQFKLMPDEITSHPSIKEQLAGADYSEDNVVYSNNILSSRGAGTAFDFALQLVSIIKNKEIADKIQNDIVLNI